MFWMLEETKTKRIRGISENRQIYIGTDWGRDTSYANTNIKRDRYIGTDIYMNSVWNIFEHLILT